MDSLDDQLREKLRNHSSRVPDDMWSGIAGQRFDQQFRERLYGASEQVSDDIWAGISAHQFDQTLAKRLQGYTAIVPEGMWDRVYGKLQSKDRTPIYVLLALLLLVSSGVIWYKTHGTGQDILEEAKSIENTHTGQSTVNLNPGNREDNQLLALAPVTSEKTQISTSNETIEAFTKPAGPTDQHPIKSSESNAEPSLHQIEKDATNIPLDSKASDVNLATVDSSERDIKVRAIGHDQRPFFKGLNVIPSGSLALLDFNRNPQINCPNLSVGRQNSLFFELRLTPGYPLRNLKDTSIGGEASDYLNKRRNTENPTSTFGLEALVGLEIKDFEIKTGLAVSQIHEVFDYVDQTSSRTIVDTIRDTNGDIIDISVVREYGTRLKRTNNRYTFVDVPLILGYRLRPREGHSLWIRAGGYLNLAFMKKGTILSPEDDLLDIKDSGDFRTTVGLRGLLSLGYELEITDKNSLGLELMYSHPFNNITQASAPIQQSYQRAQIGLSWKHKLW